MAAPGDRLIWRLDTPTGEIRCHMLTCCSGAELQIVENGDIVVRELYPEKSDLYERAQMLKAGYGRRSG